MHHITIHFRATFYVDSYSTEFHTRIHETVELEDDHEIKELYWNQKELLWEDGQATSVAIALREAGQAFCRYAGLAPHPRPK